MERSAPVSRIEPRWPVASAILAVLALLVGMPTRLWVFTRWFPYIVAIVVLVPIVAVSIASDKTRWLRVERTITLLFCAVVGSTTVKALATLVVSMVHRSGEFSGIHLLVSSIAVWVTNVLVFSFLYWQVDRGGPEARSIDASPRPDWLFPQAGASPEDVPPGWRPTFVDYMALAFCTATAFSPTDVLPLTSRAKLAMMLESTISLATIVVVASRAINILGN